MVIKPIKKNTHLSIDIFYINPASITVYCCWPRWTIKTIVQDNAITWENLPRIINSETTRSSLKKDFSSTQCYSVLRVPIQNFKCFKTSSSLYNRWHGSHLKFREKNKYKREMINKIIKKKQQEERDTVIF